MKCLPAGQDPFQCNIGVVQTQLQQQKMVTFSIFAEDVESVEIGYTLLRSMYSPQTPVCLV